MTEEFRSILIGTAGLSVAGVIALLLTLARGGVDASPGKTVRDAPRSRNQRGNNAAARANALPVPDVLFADASGLFCSYRVSEASAALTRGACGLG